MPNIGSNVNWDEFSPLCKEFDINQTQPILSQMNDDLVIFIQLENDIKAIQTNTSLRLPLLGYHSQIIKSGEYDLRQFVLDIHRPFYPDISMENILIFNVSIPEGFLNLLFDNQYFLPEKYHDDLDNLIENIRSLVKLNDYFDLIKNKENLKDHSKVSLRLHKSSAKTDNMLETSDIKSPKENEIRPMDPESDRSYSEISYNKFYFLYNEYNFQGHVITEMSQLPFILNDSNFVYMRVFLPELKLVKGLDLFMDTISSEGYKKQFNQLFQTEQLFLVQINNFIETLKQQSMPFFKPDCYQIVEFLRNNYLFSNEVGKRIKFSNIFEQLCEEMKIDQNYRKFVKTLLPQILKDLNLEKKRYSDGMYWFGICPKEKPINSIESKYVDMTRLYPTKVRDTVEEVNEIPVVIKRKSAALKYRAVKCDQINKSSLISLKSLPVSKGFEFHNLSSSNLNNDWNARVELFQCQINNKS